MPFVNFPQSCSSDPELNTRSSPPTSTIQRPPVRPSFHHQNTNDRIREGSGTPPSFSMISKIKKDRKSVFKELGLDDTDEPATSNSPRYIASEHEFGYITGLSSPTGSKSSSRRPPQQISTESDTGSDGDGDDGRSETEKPRAAHQRGDQQQQSEYADETARRSPPTTPTSSTSSSKPWYSKLTPGRRPRIKTVASAPPSTMSSRLSTTALLIAVVLPAFSYYNGRAQVSLNGADAGVIRSTTSVGSPIPVLETRADSPTDVCARWAHQAAQINGTLYIYGGQARKNEDQTTDTWNNYFLTLDLTKSWDVGSPPLNGLPQPSGPPRVAMGYLWNDYNSLFLYGGQFADNPFVEPEPVSVWRYAVRDREWTEFRDPKTSRGNNSDGGDTFVQRSAEGAGLSVPELGMSWYFGGHLDLSTTPGWSNQIHRVYLKSLLEFTHPGYNNDGVESLVDKGAPEGGAYRNITEGGLQTDEGFTERADGVLVFVPGWGERGVLIGLAGGTNETFVDDLRVLDVYDIARSEWYHQETRGDPPSVRVNPCAVIASAPDASSFQIYLYGGQNLLPYGEQIQYSDMYILSIPSFTWIKAPQSGPDNNQPDPRAGHTCHLRDGQMVIVGGYTGQSRKCDMPGVYVFDASTLQWMPSFSALDHPADLSPENSVLAGSFGYRVPDVVASVIGGDGDGGATATTPAAGPATGGPFATGKSPAFTITDAGSTATVTRWGPGATGTAPPGEDDDGDDGGDGEGGGSKSRQGGLIAAGVIAGLAGALALYLGYCAWLYRRQVRAYKSHLAITNRYAGASTGGLGGGWSAFFLGGRKGSKESKKSSRGSRGSRASRRATTAAAAGALGVNRHHLRDESRSTASGGGEAGDRNSWGPGYYGGAPPPATEPKFMFDDDEPTPESGYYSGTGASGAGASGMSRPPPVVGSWWADSSAGGSHGSGGTGNTGTGTTPGTHSHGPASGRGSMSSPPAAVGFGGGGGAGEKMAAAVEEPRRTSGESYSSTEALLEGQEPSFFSVVLGPRRALRVVNGLEGEVGHYENEHDDDTDEGIDYQD